MKDGISELSTILFNFSVVQHLDKAFAGVGMDDPEYRWWELKRLYDYDKSNSIVLAM